MASFDENGKYIKTDWKAGDKITATKLNKIEESIEAVNDNDISRHVEADARLDALEAKDVAHDKEFKNVKNLIADNKAAAELGDYEINSRMQFLEQELNEGIEEVHNVASTVDGKIAAAEANMTSAVNQGKADMAAMVAEVEGDLEGLHAKDEELSAQLADNANEINSLNSNKTDWINIISLGAEPGIDSTSILQYAVDNYDTVYIPNEVFIISGTVILNKSVTITGGGYNSILRISGQIKTDRNSEHLININNIRLENYRIIGNAVEIIKDNNSNPVNCLNINNVYFHSNNNASSSLTSSILYIKGIREATISNCIFKGSSSIYGTGIIFEGDSSQMTMNITVTGCNFYYIGTFIDLRTDASNMIYLAGIRLINNMYIGGNYGIKASYVDYMQISDSMFDFVNSPIYCDTVNNLIVNNNYLQTQDGQCIYLANNKSNELRNANISDNYMWSTQSGKVVNGIVFEGIANKISFSIIKNNTYTNLHKALNLKNCSNCTISGNVGNDSTYFLDAESSILLDIFGNYGEISVRTFFTNLSTSCIVHDNRHGTTKNYRRGRAIFSGDGTTTEFKISYSLITPTINTRLIISVSHIDLLGIPYVANFNNMSEIIVNFQTPPPKGNNNVVIDYDISNS